MAAVRPMGGGFSLELPSLCAAILSIGGFRTVSFASIHAWGRRASILDIQSFTNGGTTDQQLRWCIETRVIMMMMKMMMNDFSIFYGYGMNETEQHQDTAAGCGWLAGQLAGKASSGGTGGGRHEKSSP
jgi:hypothetical protein